MTRPTVTLVVRIEVAPQENVSLAPIEQIQEAFLDALGMNFEGFYVNETMYEVWDAGASE